MVRFPLIILSVLLWCSVAFAATENIYVAQTAAGADDGTSCANAKSASWFNTSGNWSSTDETAGKIDPGDIVHLCGTITSTLTAQGSGAAANVITLIFESGAKLSQAYCAQASGCLSLSGRNYITVDGNNVGIIEATANGTSPTYANQQNSIGVIISGSNVTIKNLTIQNIYRHISVNDTSISTASAMRVLDASSSITIDNVTVDHARGGVDFVADPSNMSTITVKNCNFGNVNFGINIAGSASANTVTDFLIHNNHIHDYATWDTTVNQYHHDGIHAWGNGTTYSNLRIYNNTFDGDLGNNITAHIFLENSAANTDAYIFNNIFAASNNPSGGDMVAITFTGVTRWYNNTFKCVSAGAGPPNLHFYSGSTFHAKNNVVINCGTFIWKATGSTIAASGLNNNVYVSCSGSLCWRHNANNYTTLANWQSGSGQDASAVYGTDAGLDVNYLPQAGSIVLNAGADLTSLGITPLNSDKAGVARPNGAAWEAGAYEYDAGAPAPVTLKSRGSGVVGRRR